MHATLNARIGLREDDKRLEKAALLLCEFAGAEAVRRSLDAVKRQDHAEAAKAQEAMEAVDALHATVTGEPLFAN